MLSVIQYVVFLFLCHCSCNIVNIEPSPALFIDMEWQRLAMEVK